MTRARRDTPHTAAAMILVETAVVLCGGEKCGTALMVPSDDPDDTIREVWSVEDLNEWRAAPCKPIVCHDCGAPNVATLRQGAEVPR